MLNSVRCSCGYNSKDKKNASQCNVKTAFKNHVVYPPLSLIPSYLGNDKNESSIYDCFDSNSNNRHWATLLQLETSISHFSLFPSERWIATNTYGENLCVQIYKDYSEDEKPTTFHCKDLIKGRTLAVLYPDQAFPKGLMINFINYDTCYVFKASLNQVLREGEHLLNDADLKSQNKTHACFQCGTNSQVTKQCSECKLSKYCSRKCQVDHWHSVHKNLCKQGDMLLRLACLPRFKSEEKISFRNEEDLTKAYMLPMPKYVYAQAYEQKTIESRALRSLKMMSYGSYLKRTNVNTNSVLEWHLNNWNNSH